MSLRILRKGATITELNIAPETVALVEEINKTVFGNKSRWKYLKQLLGHSLCCLCNGVPNIQISHDLGGFRKVEYYCTACAEQLWARDDPIDSNELAAKYNCVIGELPRTPGYDNNGKEIFK